MANRKRKRSSVEDETRRYWQKFPMIVYDLTKEEESHTKDVSTLLQADVLPSAYWFANGTMSSTRRIKPTDPNFYNHNSPRCSHTSGYHAHPDVPFIWQRTSNFFEEVHRWIVDVPMLLNAMHATVLVSAPTVPAELVKLIVEYATLYRMYIPWHPTHAYYETHRAFFIGSTTDRLDKTVESLTQSPSTLLDFLLRNPAPFLYGLFGSSFDEINWPHYVRANIEHLHHSVLEGGIKYYLANWVHEHTPAWA